MPVVKFAHIISCSSENKEFPAENLLSTETFKKWKCRPGEQQATVIIGFEKASKIYSVDIGNEGSAFIEVLGGRSSDSTNEYKILFPAVSFLSPAESRQMVNANRVRIFGHADMDKKVLDESFDRIKVVCSQPFNRSVGYGLAFIQVHSPPEADKGEDGDRAGPVRVGKFILRDSDLGDEVLVPGSRFRSRLKKTDNVTAEAKDKSVSASQLSEDNEEKRDPQLQRSRTGHIAPKPAASPIESPARKRSPSGKQRDERRSTEATEKPSLESSKKSDFTRILSDVVFVLSGFKNPYRTELRSKAIAMGAKYKPDWERGCTHLICAFPNTPKYNEVKGTGNVVRKEWIIDCYTQRTRLPLTRYKFDKGDPDFFQGTSAADKTNSTERPARCSPSPKNKRRSKSPRGSSSSPKKLKRSSDSDRIYDAPTEEDTGSSSEAEVRSSQVSRAQLIDEAKDEKVAADKKQKLDDEGLPVLPDFFAGKHFFLFGDFVPAERQKLTRCIIAYNGTVENYMSKEVTHVVTHCEWDKNFDDAIAENPTLTFVRPDWVLECGRRSKLVSCVSYEISK